MEGKRKVGKDALTKSQYMKFFPIVLLVAIICFIHTFNYFFNTYNPYIIIENEGFMLGNNQLTNILNKEDITNYDNNLDTVDMHEANHVYKTALNKYTNEDKKSIDISYPLFINDGLSIVNYNDNVNLISTNLRRSIGGANQVFSYGKAYELNNYEPIDNVSYILLNYSNGIYINLYDLKVKTNANEYDIPVNSFIYFFDNQINYFERNNDIFSKKQIVDIDYDSILSFYYDSLNQKYDYRYEDLLVGLGKLFKEEIEMPPKKIIKEEDQIEVIEEVVDPIEPTPQPIIKETDWIKPTVTGTELTAGVYSATGKITINDPAGVIVKAPSYTFVNNGKTYSRKSFYTSGDFTISGLKPDSTFDVIGQYTYLDEDLKTRKIVTFFADTITTKSMDSLDSIELSFSLGEIYSRKIELKDLKITSDINSEVLKGVRSVAFTIDGEDYYLSTANVSSLINGKTLPLVSTSDSLSSNREYNFEISFYDTVGSKLKVLNGKDSTRTSKKAPSAVVKVVKNEVDYLILGVDLKNDDNVNISNYHYVVSNISGKVIEQNMIDGNRIRLDNMDPNQMFIIKVFGDYDLNDGNGLNKDVELAGIEFTSLPITSLGFLNLNFDIDDISSDSVSLKYKINSNKTDARLIKLVKEINFEVYDVTNNRIVRTFSIGKNDIDSLTNLEELTMNIDGLVSNNKYALNINTVVKQGDTTYNLECLHNLDSFETHKKKPVIDMTSSFVTNDMIDFDVRVVDTDHAILSNRVRVELRDSSNKLITSKLIEINSEYERITYKYLNTNSTYYIIFIADEYNETNNNSTYKSRYELAKVEKFTENGISGKIELNSAVRVANGENLVDINSETKWVQTTNYYTNPKTIDKDGNIHIYSKSGPAAYTYDLSAYHGEYVTATFKIKAITRFNEKLYFGNHISGTNSTTYSMLLDDIKTDEWTTYTRSFIVGSVTNGKQFNNNRGLYFGRYNTDFIGFYFDAGITERAEYVIKDFEIHISKEKVPVDASGYQVEMGGYNGSGVKDNSYGNRRARISTPIILEGNQLYEFYFSDDINCTAYINFYELNANRYISSRDWFDSGGSVYVPANSRAYVVFRYYSGNMDINLDDINLRINKYTDRELTGNKEFTYDFVTKARVNIKDLHNEITNDTYYIRVSDKNNHELYVNSYEELADTDTIVNALKKINLEENKEYRVSLFIKVRDREYELDYFNISTDNETVGVENTNDWALMQPYGNYIILNNLDFNGFTSQNLGWGPKHIHGMIDFQGYSAELYSKNNYSRLGVLQTDAVVKNMVLNVHLDNDVNKTDITGFIKNNYGLIENVIINVYDERPKNFNDTYLNLLVDTNSVGGIVRNFVVNLKTKVNLYAESALLVRINNGLIEQGYIYGENAIVTNETTAAHRTVSLVEKYGGLKSVVQNVFVLSGIEFPNNASNDLTGLFAHETYGTVQNVYTTGSVSNIRQDIGPIIGRIYATAVLSNAHYLSDYIYTTANQNKISAAAINDLSFQKSVLKSGFNIDEMIELGYYPQVVFTYEKMPKQEFIELPKIEDKDLVDILNIEIISQTNNHAVVELTVQNEFGDEITNIAISNLDTNIVSQTYEDGKSYVRLEVSNPSVYVSKYEIRSITSKSYNNISSERKYSPGDKYLFIEMYREIKNVSDWLKINNYLNQNFAIMSDLDFKEYSNYYVNNYSGTIKGNNHVLRNISIVSDKGALFNQLNGTMRDIYFENIVKTSNSQYNGIIGSTNQYTKLDNVHVKNFTITIPSTRTSNTIYAGGLAGYAYYSKFTNCSVTDLRISSEATISDIQIGGLVGYSNATTINNVYAQNIDIYVQNSISTLGVGGIVGREGNSNSVGIIQDAYATGRIYNNGRFTGGIIGNTYGYVENTYSMVNIVSEMKDTGGIAGNAYTPSYINNNLYVGNLSSKVDETFHRVIGSGASNNTNFALETGLINGVVSNENNGETLIGMSDLLKSSTYSDKIKLGESYDYSNVSEGIIPKMYYMGTKDLLPNQEDIYFYKDSLGIDDIVIDKHVDYSSIVLYLKNPNHYIIDDVVIENMNATITQNSYENGISIIAVDAVPLKYYDSYYFKEIKYHIDGDDKELTSEKSVFLEMMFYKNLSTYEDWQNVSKTDAENYILTNDIDFTGKTFNREVVFNRLETSGSEKYAIKGMSIVQTSNKYDLNIFKKVMSSIKGVTFKDITIDFPQTSSASYTSIFNYLYGEVRDVDFENITILAPYKERVGIIGRAYTNVIDNIKLKHITVSGKNDVGGLFAFYENKETTYVTNIEAEDINVTGTSNYIGGIWSRAGSGFDGIKNIYGVSIKDSTVSSPNGSYVGGIGGSADASDAVVDNVTVIGREYVGAAFGYNTAYQLYNVHVMNSTVEGSYRNIGGLAGQIRSQFYDSVVENTNVTGTAIDTEAVGGVLGYHGGGNVARVSIKNSTVNNNGIKTGGFVGSISGGSISNTSTDNVIVNGVNYVGGLAGALRNGTILVARITNCTINAQENYAGGIVGYVDNSNSGTSFVEGSFKTTMVLASNITSNSYAGGLVGKMNERLYNANNNGGLYVDSSISTVDNETAYLGGANYNDQLVNLGRSGFYRNTLINNVPVKDTVTNTLDTNNLITSLTPGLINNSTGQPEMNYNYPAGTYTNFLLLRAGKTYLLRAKNRSLTQMDHFRGMIYDTNYNFQYEIGWNSPTMNYLGRYMGLSYLNEVYFTPVRDVVLRIMFYYELEDASIVEVKSSNDNIITNRLFSESDLRNRLTWNRYMSDNPNQYNFLYISSLNYDAATWDFSTLKTEKLNAEIQDKSGNNHTAIASYSSKVDEGIFMGDARDIVTVNNYTPENKITISAKITSYVTRSYQYVFSYRDPSKSSGVGLFIHDKRIYAMINGSVYSAERAIPLYKECTITMTYEDNAKLKVYLNGELIYTKNNVNAAIKTSDNAKTYIGYDPTYTSGYKFLGIISYVHVYNRALGATEVSNNYHQSSGVTDSSGLQLSYDFTELDFDEPGYYPEMIEVPEQASVPLPVKARNMMLGRSTRKMATRSFTPIYDEQLEDNYHIYSSGIDTINIEFDKISNDLSFTYQIGDKEETISVERRVYTLHYDYNSDIVIQIRNSFEEKTINLTKNDLAKTIAIYNGSYYYIDNNKLYNSDNFVIDNAKHIYKNLVLLNDNSIYNLETGNIQNPIQTNNTIVSTIPLYQTTIEGNIVDTYYKFTEITDANSEVTIRDNQLIYKDGYLHVINFDDKDNSTVIVNNYNGNEYQIVLGKNSELYSYKTSLDLNSSFINANIKEIAADFESNSPIIMVKYYNGEILVLNYYDGSKLYRAGEGQNISLFDFIGLSFKSNDLSSGNSSYNSNNSLTESLNNLTDEEISEILNNAAATNNNSNNVVEPIDENNTIDGNGTNNSQTPPVDGNTIVKNNTVNTRYVVSYNEYKDEYEVYDTNDILFGDVPITVNSKIDSNKALYNYFYNNTKINDIFKDNRIIIYIAIITLIVANLIYVVSKYRRKGVGNE